MSERRFVAVLVGSVEPEVADGLGAALADGERLRVLESDILAAIRRAVLGAATLVHVSGVGAVRRSSEPTRDLTPRETQVLELLRKGQSNREIADHLTISVETVRTHVTRIFRKLNVHSRHQLVEIRVQTGESASE
jgi:DNA-binding NarL/FixJ family response regulator